MSLFTSCHKRTFRPVLDLRTHDPKYTNYWGNGAGRDSYVITDNGGQAHQPKRHMMRRPYRSTYSAAPNRRSSQPSAVIYQSDGTGRDSYVLQNSGGLVHDYGHSMPADSLFRQTLRFCPKRVIETAHVKGRSTSQLEDYQNWPTASAKHFLHKQSKISKEVTERLSASPVRKKLIRVSPLTKVTSF